MEVLGKNTYIHTLVYNMYCYLCVCVCAMIIFETNCQYSACDVLLCASLKLCYANLPHYSLANQMTVLNVCAAPALRTPLSYAAPFAMMGHHPEMNGSLSSTGVYGLISPQMSAAAAYGRPPMVRSLLSPLPSPPLPSPPLLSPLPFSPISTCVSRSHNLPLNITFACVLLDLIF